MVKKEVSATAKDGNAVVGNVTVTVNFPETVQEALDNGISEEALLSNAFANWKVTLQSAIRNRIKAGKSPDEIQADMDSAKMGVTMTANKVDPQQAFINKFKTANPEEQARMLALLQEAAQA